MYAPPLFRENRQEVLLSAMADLRFATLAVCRADRLAVAHAPMVAHRNGDGLILEAHVARGNEVEALAREGATAIAVFQGPQAYIRPGWRETKRQTGKAVPTWNYVAVQAKGRLAATEDESWLRAHLDRLTSLNESGKPEPWSAADAPKDYMRRQLKQIVGLRLAVEALEGSWKMSQNHSEPDQIGERDGLRAEGGAQGEAVAAIMEEIADASRL